MDSHEQVVVAAALLVLGAMSVFWMALFFVAVTLEKTGPFGPGLSRVHAAALAAGAVAWTL